MTYDYEPGSVPLFNGMVILERVGDRWRFKHPVKFFYAVMPDYTLYLESLAMGIIAEGHGWKALFRDLDDELLYAWEEYAMKDDCNLHESGIKYKKTLLDSVEFLGGDSDGDIKT